MCLRFITIVLSTIFTAIAVGNSVHPPISESVAISQTSDSIEITVPVSNLVLKFPKASFIVENSPHGGATNSPRYFLLRDKLTGAVVSGWFESAEGAADLRKSWATEMVELKKKGFGEPAAVEEMQIGPWRTITYGIAMTSGSSTHIRASLVQSGTWIDIHLSASSEAPAEQTRRVVTEMLNSLEVREKRSR
jgi:hypothetical protein